MDLEKQINEHEAAIHRLKAQQKRCPHEFGEPYRTVIETEVPVQENRPIGSDFFNPVIVGWEIKKTDVWERKCKSCGLTERTAETEPVIKEHRPKFR